MRWTQESRPPGIAAALGAALLFGAGTPLAKILLGRIDPWFLAGLLYLGSGIGLTLYRWLRRAERVRLPTQELPWLAAAIVAGGVVGPVLLMLGLNAMPASGASLLLNAESVFTALLAWFVFKENFDRRIALGMLAIVAGAVVLNVSDQPRFATLWPALAVLGACLAWGVDNNLTRKVSLGDATWIASVKGLVAGTVNLAIAFAMRPALPSVISAVEAMIVGLLAYGISLTLFVVALRHLGAARTSAYFSIAPFFGALLAFLMGEPLTGQIVAASALMAIGIALHLTERHEHLHTHEPVEHEHEHIHDAHHEHAEPEAAGVRHSHSHRHAPLTHSHVHFPDAHHQHPH